MRCEWVAWCDDRAIGVAVYTDTDRDLAPRAVCFGHQLDAQGRGWHLRTFGRKRVTNDLICWCDPPLPDAIGGCCLCGKLVVTRATVDGFYRHGHREAARLGEVILVEQARRRAPEAVAS